MTLSLLALRSWAFGTRRAALWRCGWGGSYRPQHAAQTVAMARTIPESPESPQSARWTGVVHSGPRGSTAGGPEHSSGLSARRPRERASGTLPSPEDPPSRTATKLFAHPETALACGRVGNNRRRYLRGPRSVIEEYADVCPTTSRGAARGPKKTSDSVRVRDVRLQLGKTCQIVVRGGGEADVAACAVGKHPERNSPSLDWFALGPFLPRSPVVPRND